MTPVAAASIVLLLSPTSDAARRRKAHGVRVVALTVSSDELPSLVSHCEAVFPLVVDPALAEDFCSRVLTTFTIETVVAPEHLRRLAQRMARELRCPLELESDIVESPAGGATQRGPVSARTAAVVINQGSYAELVRSGSFPVAPHEFDVHLISRRWQLSEARPETLPARVYALDLRDRSRLERLCDWIISTYEVEALTACHEATQEVAARVRARHALPGPNEATTEAFRDKLLMKGFANQAGLPVPRHARVESVDDIRAFAGERIVLKPVRSWGSQGVTTSLTTESAIAAWESAGRPDGMEVEEHVDGPIYHSDSTWTAGVRRFNRVSRYIGVPGDFARATHFGSILLPVHDPIAVQVSELDQTLTRALEFRDGATHFECFVPPGTFAPRLVFCETAARYGGGGVPDMLHAATGFDIAAAGLRAALRLPVALDDLPTPDSHWFGYVGLYPQLQVQPTNSELLCLPGVVSVTRLDRSSDRPATNCVDFTLRVVLRGGSEDDLLRHVAAVVAKWTEPGSIRSNPATDVVG